MLVLLWLLLLALNIASGGHPGPCKHDPCSAHEDSYINSNGDEISMPVNTDEPPEGATAQCRNGDYSFSQHRSGTCSREGGVEVWF